MDELAVLPVLPWTAAAVVLVVLVGLQVGVGGPRAGDADAGRPPLAGRLGAAVLAVAAVGAALGARLGPEDALTNPVPALVVGLAWPLLLVLPALLSPLVRRRRGEGPADVRPAVVAAVAVVAYLVVPPDPTAPRTLAPAVAGYALVVAAAAVAVGRRTAARGEALGLLAVWSALGPRLVRWRPPVGATAVLAVVLGGAWAERYERTATWREGDPGWADVALGLLGSLLLAALLAALLVRGTRQVPGTAAAVLLPLAAGAVVAGVARRALISAQLLVGRTVDPDPFGVAGGQAVALGLAAVGGVAAAAVLARRCGPGAARLPGLGVVAVVTAVTSAVVLEP